MRHQETVHEHLHKRHGCHAAARSVVPSALVKKFGDAFATASRHALRSTSRCLLRYSLSSSAGGWRSDLNRRRQRRHYESRIVPIPQSASQNHNVYPPTTRHHCTNHHTTQQDFLRLHESARYLPPTQWQRPAASNKGRHTLSTMLRPHEQPHHSRASPRHTSTFPSKISLI